MIPCLFQISSVTMSLIIEFDIMKFYLWSIIEWTISELLFLSNNLQNRKASLCLQECKKIRKFKIRNQRRRISKKSVFVYFYFVISNLLTCRPFVSTIWFSSLYRVIELSINTMKIKSFIRCWSSLFYIQLLGCHTIPY